VLTLAKGRSLDCVTACPACLVTCASRGRSGLGMQGRSAERPQLPPDYPHSCPVRGGGQPTVRSQQACPSMHIAEAPPSIMYVRCHMGSHCIDNMLHTGWCFRASCLYDFLISSGEADRFKPSTVYRSCLGFITKPLGFITNRWEVIG